MWYRQAAFDPTKTIRADATYSSIAVIVLVARFHAVSQRFETLEAPESEKEETIELDRQRYFIQAIYMISSLVGGVFSLQVLIVARHELLMAV